MKLLLTIFILLSSTAAAAFAEDSIVYMNFDKFYRGSKIVSAVRDSISVEFRQRDTELRELAQKIRDIQEELEKEDLALSEEIKQQKRREAADLDRELLRKGRALAEDRNLSFQERRGVINSEVMRLVRQLAKEKGYRMVLNPFVTLPFNNDRPITQEIVLYAEDSVDITDEVVELFDQEAKIN